MGQRRLQRCAHRRIRLLTRLFSAEDQIGIMLRHGLREEQKFTQRHQKQHVEEVEEVSIYNNMPESRENMKQTRGSISIN